MHTIQIVPLALKVMMHDASFQTLKPSFRPYPRTRFQNVGIMVVADRPPPAVSTADGFASLHPCRGLKLTLQHPIFSPHFCGVAPTCSWIANVRTDDHDYCQCPQTFHSSDGIRLLRHGTHSTSSRAQSVMSKSCSSKHFPNLLKRADCFPKCQDGEKYSMQLSKDVNLLSSVAPPRPC